VSDSSDADRTGARAVLDPKMRERVVVTTAAGLLGLGAGAGVLLFKAAIAAVDSSAATPLARTGWWMAALVPALGGVIVGLLVAYVIGHERHHGVAGIVEALALDGGRMRYWRAPPKAVAAAIGIGTGASVGPEDPSVQIGASLGSFLGRKFRLSDDRVRMLVAAGAAAGIAAAFNAPIAGVFFAVEILLGDFAGSGLGIILVAAVLSSVLAQSLVGPDPAFAVPRYELRSAWELPAYVVLGAVAGPVAALYVVAIDKAKRVFDASRLPVVARPALAGLAVGVVALALPQVRGVGYETVEAVLRDAGPTAWTLVAIVAAKLVLTSTCIGAGVPGGVFAPSLVLGAALGGAFGAAMNAAFPSLGVVPGAYAMVGMAAVLTGTVHAPLTAVVILFEMTRDYRILLPTMLAVAVSMFVARLVERESVYSMALARKGIRHRALTAVDVEQFVVDEGSSCDGRAVGEIPWPHDCVVARVRRGQDLITPKSDTVLRAGDVVVAVVGAEERDKVRALVRAAPVTDSRRS
jgi:CIC family chloride channel protein